MIQGGEGEKREKEYNIYDKEMIQIFKYYFPGGFAVNYEVIVHVFKFDFLILNFGI